KKKSLLLSRSGEECLLKCKKKKKKKAEKVNTRGFTIMNQVKDLLLNDHSSVLPPLIRCPPLSDALLYQDLYKEFNALKERLGELTTMFEGVESSVDDMRLLQHMNNTPPPEFYFEKASVGT
uniref:Uncharacterized protein n=1 Tax=Oncorhynchus tshawytscha TaxID=74940 RepID=A0AAZ3SSN7_ONCTS